MGHGTDLVTSRVLSDMPRAFGLTRGGGPPGRVVLDSAFRLLLNPDLFLKDSDPTSTQNGVISSPPGPTQTKNDAEKEVRLNPDLNDAAQYWSRLNFDPNSIA